MEFLRETFRLVCSQHNCWAPGGELLPFCQRCTGLYVGVTVAVVLQVLCRPRFTLPLLCGHGLPLLLMVPLGYHWIETGSLVRVMSGQLFAAGLVCYLLFLPSSCWSPWWDREDRYRWLLYSLGLAVSLPLLQGVIHLGGRPGAILLSVLGGAGLVLLGGLALGNVLLLGWLILGWVWRWRDRSKVTRETNLR